MMGKTHLALGAAGYVAYAGVPNSIDQLPGWGLGLGVTLIASIAADIEEPKSTAGKLVMPFVPSWLRPAAFVLVGGLLAWHGYKIDSWLIAIIGTVLVAAAIAKHRNSPTHGSIGFIFASAMTYMFWPIMLIPVVIGYGLHLIADAITEGIPIFWPFKFWFRIPLMKTNSFLDKVVIRYASILFIGYQVIQEFNFFS